MALFTIHSKKVNRIKSVPFRKEKDLQSLIESNLVSIFNCRFIASEFGTGSVHSGRIDTLALSEDDCPVIIEYKNATSSDLLNQSLYYLSWIKDHKGDFQVAVNRALGNEVQVDWSEIRVIYIAPEYKKYDLHAAQMMGGNVELWQFKLYEDNLFVLEEVFRKSIVEPDETRDGKNPIMVEAGKKAAITRQTAVYTVEEHRSKLKGDLVEIFDEVRDYIVKLHDSIEETPKKQYIAYKISQNFVCLEVQRNKMILFLKLEAKEMKSIPEQGRDVSNIGHFGTGNFEFTIHNKIDFEQSKEYIKKSFDNIGA